MTDAFASLAAAEDRSFAQEELKDLIEEYGSPIFDGTAWRFPVPEGEDK